MKQNSQTKVFTVIYLIFLCLFVVLPLLVVFIYGFTDENFTFSLQNIFAFFTNGKMVGTLIYSVVIAIFVTFFCFLLAYPVAYILAKGVFCKKHTFLMLFVLPMWINFTLRISALKEILTVLEQNIAYYPFFNTVLCMVYDFLPFMILPLYHTLEKIDSSYLEAAMDLGATRMHIMKKIVLPLSVPGIISGMTMVFLPAMTNYVVLDMVYNQTFIMGSLIGSYFSSYDWHNGSMVSVVLLGCILCMTMFSNRFSDEKNV